MQLTLALAALGSLLIAPQIPYQDPKDSGTPDKIAMLPWTFQEGTDTAMTTARETIDTLFHASHCSYLDEGTVLAMWEGGMKQAKLETRVFGPKDYMPDLPGAKYLLTLGKKLSSDFVVAGRCKWSTDSKWVALGPKTKAWCTVDVLIVDVKNAELDLESLNVTANSTRVEKGWETAGSLLISAGFTMFSGGPKTPHQQRAAQMAIGKALEPWLKERQIVQRIPKKIEDTGSTGGGRG